LHDVAPQTYAPHELLATVPHAPAPSQTRVGVYVEPLHDSVAQVMPAIHLRHAPVPLHMPSVPQVDGACCGHSSSGSEPAGIGRQRPSA
jgi:hypothetical protein